MMNVPLDVLSLETSMGQPNLSGISFVASGLYILLKQDFSIPVLLENYHVFSLNTFCI